MTEILVLVVVLLSPMCLVPSVGDNVTSIHGEPAFLTHMYEAHYARHRHHPNHPFGPHFEENAVNVTIREGQNAFLDCKVGFIDDFKVSWVRRKSEQLDLLTLGTKNHSSDTRFLSDFKYPNNWRLAIRQAKTTDTGTYLCQISTHPLKVLEVYVSVEAPEVFIVNLRGERIHDVHYKEGSTLTVQCLVNNLKSKSLNWFRNSDMLNHDVSRGGVSIKTEMVSNHAKSVLNVARISRKDAGIFTCSSPPHNASITVHILNGENPAEWTNNHAMASSMWSWKCILLIFVLWVSK